MDCPKCVGKLEKKKVEGIEIDACSVCEGIWFDAGELQDVVKADSKDFDYIDVGKEEFDGAELEVSEIDLDSKKGKCPRCEDGTMLAQSQYDKDERIKVDICPKGHGTWLDGGEIQKLRKKSFDYWKKLIKYSFTKDGLTELWNNAFRG
ncbi:MAG: zf-TFIIB domain-containing protein [Candidatus Omnitrophica bacterium]|nr:zf-TFIIB domain-containing protein [Candidatus Omnitrophota bacterium]